MAIQPFEKNLSDLREIEATVQRLTQERGRLVEAEAEARAENEAAGTALGTAEANYHQALISAPGTPAERAAYGVLRAQARGRK